MSAIADRLRHQATSLRTKPTPLADLIPLLTQAADELTKLAVESEALKAENFTLAAGQCVNATADEGGRPYCKELAELRSLKSYQERIHDWMLACFGDVIAADRTERNHRFLEEALELVQSLGCTQHEAHQLVDYVFGRPIGEPMQELGGVMVTLAALSNAQNMDITFAAETELARVWTKVEQIRAKQAAKPKYSPLPEAVKEGA